MAGKRDGVEDGWLLFEAWCRRNGGTPFRGRSSADHVCAVGPIDQTIEPGDPGTVDLTGPGGRKPTDLVVGRLDLAVKAAELKVEQARQDLRAAEHAANAVRKKKKS